MLSPQQFYEVNTLEGREVALLDDLALKEQSLFPSCTECGF